MAARAKATKAPVRRRRVAHSRKHLEGLHTVPTTVEGLFKLWQSSGNKGTMKDFLMAIQGQADMSRKTKYAPWKPVTNPKIIKRLGKTGEEASELANICFRILVQGINGVNPKTGVINRKALQDEIADVLGQCLLCIDKFELDGDAILARMASKMKAMQTWEAKL